MSIMSAIQLLDDAALYDRSAPASENRRSAKSRFSIRKKGSKYPYFWHVLQRAIVEEDMENFIK